MEAYNYSTLIKKGSTTNVDLVTTMMNHSHAGVLTQAFVIQAIRRMADQVASDPDKIREQMEANGSTGFVNPDAWIQAALDCKAAIETRDGR